MPKYIAFLRAINVGGHIVKMDRLRELFEESGFTNVETFIASGNVIFDSPRKDRQKLEKAIEQHLAANLGYEVSTFIRTPEETAAVAAHEPFGERGDRSLYVGFTSDAIGEAACAKLMAARSPIDEFHVRGSDLYWMCSGRMSDSKFSNAALEKILGGRATMRNITTVAKLAAKYAGGGK